MNRLEGAALKERLREAARHVAQEQDLDLVVLFGSAARHGLAHAADLDIGVIGRGTVDLVALTSRFVAVLGVQAIDLVDLRRADALLLALAARDGVVLHEGVPGAFASFASLAARRFADTCKFREAEREEIADFVRRTAPRA